MPRFRVRFGVVIGSARLRDGRERKVMSKAITEGVLLMPPAFSEGLDVWANGDGTPGSDTYDSVANAVYVPADQDFGGCL